jgi:hypothetical protein
MPWSSKSWPCQYYYCRAAPLLSQLFKFSESSLHLTSDQSGTFEGRCGSARSADRRLCR